MSVTLYVPYNSPYTSEVTLRNPIFGSENVNVKMKMQQVMGGNLYTTKSTPATSNMTLQFTTLVEAIKESFVEFYEDALGKEIRYVDQDTTVWKMRVVNDSLIITERDTCNYAISIELTGEKQ